MKLTWFTRSCFRLHVGGRIIVTDPHSAPVNVAERELLSGANTVVDLAVNGLEKFDPANWARRPRLRLIDAPEEVASSVMAFAEGGLFVGSEDDAPLFVASPGAQWGRFADGAVVLLSGPFARMAQALDALSTLSRPRLIAIASDDFDERQFDDLAAVTQSLPLQVMEPGLAIEA
jgi:hypothetical protein